MEINNPLKEDSMDKRYRQSLALRIINVYFAPWGAAKAAEWEELSSDGPFDAETALHLVRAALEGR